MGKYVAQQIYKSFNKGKEFSTLRYQSSLPLINADRHGGYDFFWSSNDWGDREEITVYKDGSVFHEHIEYYDEYWIADSRGWFTDDDDIDSPYGGRGSFDRESDPCYGEIVNSLCYSAWYKDLDSFLSYSKITSRVLNEPITSDYQWYVLVSNYFYKYAPHYCAKCKPWWPSQVKDAPIIDGYNHWLRAYYSNGDPWKRRRLHNFDVFYPKDNNEKIKVQIVMNDPRKTKIVIPWEHGKHGLFRQIINNSRVEELAGLPSSKSPARLKTRQLATREKDG